MYFILRLYTDVVQNHNIKCLLLTETDDKEEKNSMLIVGKKIEWKKVWRTQKFSLKNGADQLLRNKTTSLLGNSY